MCNVYTCVTAFALDKLAMEFQTLTKSHLIRSTDKISEIVYQRQILLCQRKWNHLVKTDAYLIGQWKARQQFTRNSSINVLLRGQFFHFSCICKFKWNVNKRQKTAERCYYNKCARTFPLSAIPLIRVFLWRETNETKKTESTHVETQARKRIAIATTFT